MRTLNYPKGIKEEDKLKYLEGLVMKMANDRIEKYYSEEEVKKLIGAFRDKYDIPLCDELPYDPIASKIRVYGKKSKS